MSRVDGEVLEDVMTPEDWAHVERVEAAYSKLLRAKYRAGKSEHGGSCWLKPGMMAHAKDEHADQGVYLDTLEEQMRTLVSLLRNGEIESLAAADEIERWLHK